MKWRLVFTRQANKDARLVGASHLRGRVEALLTILETDPFQNPPPFEKLTGELTGYFSRRVNIQHRLVYQVFEAKRVIKIIRMWSHYE